MAKHLDLGRQGESLAKALLENSGYEIMDENWTFGKAEIDLIAYKDKVIIFAEVKATCGSCDPELEAITISPVWVIAWAEPRYQSDSTLCLRKIACFSLFSMLLHTVKTVLSLHC